MHECTDLPLILNQIIFLCWVQQPLPLHCNTKQGRIWIYVYFQLLNAMQPKETTMTRKSFCGQTVSPDCKQRTLLQYTLSFVCKLFKTISA